MATQNTCPKASRLSILHSAPPTHPHSVPHRPCFQSLQTGTQAGCRCSGCFFRMQTQA